jgi:hypothetical protein
MPRPWSEERKKRLAALSAAGRSPTQIAKALGLARDTVIARLALIDTWAKNRAIVERGFRKRAELRRVRAQRALAEMARAIAGGAPRNEAMAKAHAAGATWREIGEHFGITAQAARLAGIAARHRKAGRAAAAAKEARRGARSRGARH